MMLQHALSSCMLLYIYIYLSLYMYIYKRYSTSNSQPYHQQSRVSKKIGFEPHILFSLKNRKLALSLAEKFIYISAETKTWERKFYRGSWRQLLHGLLQLCALSCSLFQSSLNILLKNLERYNVSESNFCMLYTLLSLISCCLIFEIAVVEKETQKGSS